MGRSGLLQQFQSVSIEDQDPVSPIHELQPGLEDEVASMRSTRIVPLARLVCKAD